MSKENIIVQKVELDTYEKDRLQHRINALEKGLKHNEDEYLKLLHRLDIKENFGLNCMLFTFEELLEILKSQYHPLKNYIERWFSTLEDYDKNEDEEYDCLVFSEDAIEVESGDYWLVHIKNDYATKFNDIKKLSRKIYELEKEED